MIAAEVLDFRPHPLLPGGHAQTLAGVYLPGRRYPYRAAAHRVALDDGDQIVLHEDTPPTWQPGGRAALLVHGLGGCHQSGYMVRLAAKLVHRGVRVFRMDQRGCGAGFLLAQNPYHSGRQADVAQALAFIARRCAGSPVALVGYSLAGNLALNLAADCAAAPPAGLDCVIAVNPPVDLARASAALAQRGNRLYDRHFVRTLCGRLRRRARLRGQPFPLPHRPRSLREFDDLYTAPRSGFGTAENYYRLCSPAGRLNQIRLPTHILTSRDDPFVPVEPLLEARRSDAIRLVLTDHGGHLGYIARRGDDPDRRWMDWRLVEWITRP